MEAQKFRGIAGASLGQHKGHIVDLQGIDRPEDHGQEDQRPQGRERDISKKLEAVPSVDLRRLILVRGQGAQARIADQGHKRRPLPYIRQHHRGKCPVRVQPGHPLQTGQLEKVVDDPILGVQHQFPYIPRNAGRHHDRDDQHGEHQRF